MTEGEQLRDDLGDLATLATPANEVLASMAEQGIIANGNHLGAWRWGSGGLYRSENLVLNVPLRPVQVLTTPEGRRLLHLEMKVSDQNHDVYLEDNWVGKRSSDAANEVAEYGVPITGKEVHHLQQFVADALRLGNFPSKQAYRHLGWHFNRLLIPNMDSAVFIPPGGMEWLRAYGIKGGSEEDARREWSVFLERAAIEAPACLVVLGAALAAPALNFLPRTEVISFVCHFNQFRTSTGKTVLMDLGKGAVGNPNRILTTWDGTKVGIEQMLGGVRHLPLILDELGDAKLGIPETVVMMLAEEIGRRRGTSGGGLRPTAEWRTIVISSGNEPIAKGSAPHARRTLSIPVALPSDTFADWVSSISNNFHGHPLAWCIPLYGQWDQNRVRELAECYEKLYTTDIFSLKPQARYWAVVEIGSRMLLAALGLDEHIAHEAILSVARLSATRRRAEGIDYVSRLTDAVWEEVARDPGGFGVFPHKAQRGNLGRILESDDDEEGSNPTKIALLPSKTQELAHRLGIHDLTGVLLEARERGTLETDKDKKRLTKLVWVGASRVRCHVFQLLESDVTTDGDRENPDFEAGVTTCHHQNVFVTTITTNNKTLYDVKDSKVVIGGDGGDKDNIASDLKLDIVTTSVTTKLDKVVTKQEKPTDPCHACGSMTWWLKPDGEWGCGVCHPQSKVRKWKTPEKQR